MYDYVVIGGGIIGASTAWQLLGRQPQARILLLEKESDTGQHQTGRNSGIIHAGIYYEPGSLKARFCKAGVEATKAFCRDNDIPFEQCGKLLVATNDLEHERMHALYERALVNGLDVELIDTQALRRLEPNIAGTGAIHVHTTGIVDYRQVCRAMVERFRRQGGEVRLNARVTGLEEREQSLGVSLAAGERFETRYVIACAGLMADRLAHLQGLDPDFAIIPYRGEYYRLNARLSDIIDHLIYPIPDPALPFLGVHLTRMIDGSVTVGPNAVQGWKREGYGRLNVSLRDTAEMIRFPGFWRVLRENFETGLAETWHSWWKPAYLKRVQKYCPVVRSGDLEPYPAGVRAMAVRRDGSLVDDFLFLESSRSLHVCNAPSPAATSAIPIGAYVCDRVEALRP